MPRPSSQRFFVARGHGGDGVTADEGLFASGAYADDVAAQDRDVLVVITERRVLHAEYRGPREAPNDVVVVGGGGGVPGSMSSLWTLHPLFTTYKNCFCFCCRDVLRCPPSHWALPRWTKASSRRSPSLASETCPRETLTVQLAPPRTLTRQRNAWSWERNNGLDQEF
jgi:hypothetical protein